MIAAIGDIHGELGKLERLLDKLEPVLSEDDTILFIGDYIDRGPDSKGVVDLVIELKKSINVIAFRGNHEQMLLDARDFFDPRPGMKDLNQDQALLWFQNGSAATLNSYPPTGNDRWYDRIPEHHWVFFRTSLVEHVVGVYHFVHAGVSPPGRKWEEPLLDPRLWIREEFILSKMDFGRIVVFGHTPLRDGKPLVMKNKIGIDTAAAYGGPLTAVLVDTDKPFVMENTEFIQTM